MKQEPIKIFLVDDDALYLKALEIEFLQNADFCIETFLTGESCMENIYKNPDLVVLDYNLNGMFINAMNGMETLDKIKAYDPDINVIMLSSQDKIEVAVNCMHKQASDYIVKSETAFLRLRKTIATIFRISKMEKELRWYLDNV